MIRRKEANLQFLAVVRFSGATYRPSKTADNRREKQATASGYVNFSTKERSKKQEATAKRIGFTGIPLFYKDQDVFRNGDDRQKAESLNIKQAIQQEPH